MFDLIGSGLGLIFVVVAILIVIQHWIIRAKDFINDANGSETILIKMESMTLGDSNGEISLQILSSVLLVAVSLLIAVLSTLMWPLALAVIGIIYGLKLLRIVIRLTKVAHKHNGKKSSTYEDEWSEK